jgi:hypothetical protein
LNLERNFWLKEINSFFIQKAKLMWLLKKLFFKTLLISAAQTPLLTDLSLVQVQLPPALAGGESISLDWL